MKKYPLLYWDFEKFPAVPLERGFGIFSLYFFRNMKKFFSRDEYFFVRFFWKYSFESIAGFSRLWLVCSRVCAGRMKIVKPTFINMLENCKANKNCSL